MTDTLLTLVYHKYMLIAYAKVEKYMKRRVITRNPIYNTQYR